jgi:Spy/CpxP family protein refolding chaperone
LPASPRASRAKWIAGIVVIAAFVAGVLVGVAGSHLLMLHGRRPHIPGRAAHFLVARLDRRLDLTDAQEKQIEAIIARRHARMNAIWDAARPRVGEEIAATNDEIAATLTPEQRVKFEAIKMRVNTSRQPGRYRSGD